MKLDHTSYMLEAIALAKKGWYTTDPNPRVGCVIVKDNQIVGRGWHIRAGEPHAEVYALRDAGEQANGATAYVTLEPCSHFGKTPPCCDALIEAKVSHVIIAMQDPNPLVAGNGIKRLEDAGINVLVGVLEEDSKGLNPGFIHKMISGLPLVKCKMGMSLDGRTAMASGESQWITSPQSRQDVQRLRAESSAILTGIGTILDDNPSMNVRDKNYLQAKQPLKLILDSQLRTPESALILSDPKLVTIFTTLESSLTQKSKDLIQRGVTIITLQKNKNGLDLNEMMDNISKMPINNLLIETGKTLSGSLLNMGLIDELILYVAPKIMGNNARGLFDLPDLHSMNNIINFKINDIRKIGADFRIHLESLTSNDSSNNQ